MSTSAYIVYLVMVTTVAALVFMRIARHHRAPIPVPRTEESHPLKVPQATVEAMVSEMIFYAYGYRPSDELVADFTSHLMAESSLVQGGPVNDGTSG